MDSPQAGSSRVEGEGADSADVEEPFAGRGPSSWPGIVVAELKSRPFGYLVLAAFAIAGPIVTHFLFPEAPDGLGLVGGLALGIYAALCAVPQKFL